MSHFKREECYSFMSVSKPKTKKAQGREGPVSPPLGTPSWKVLNLYNQCLSPMWEREEKHKGINKRIQNTGENEDISKGCVHAISLKSKRQISKEPKADTEMQKARCRARMANSHRLVQLPWFKEPIS